jgi:hypothetical protein
MSGFGPDGEASEQVWEELIQSSHGKRLKKFRKNPFKYREVDALCDVPFFCIPFVLVSVFMSAYASASMDVFMNVEICVGCCMWLGWMDVCAYVRVDLRPSGGKPTIHR